MLVAGTIAIVAMSGSLLLLAVGGIGLALWDHHFDQKRRHWQPAESSTHW